MSRARLTRAGFLTAAGLLAGGGADAAAAILRGEAEEPLGAQPSGLPARQHAWNATLDLDEHGNRVAPRFDRLLFFDVTRKPVREDIRRLEASLRTLEHTFRWGPRGLLFTAGWGPHYFEHVLGIRSPVPHPTELSDFELPTLDSYDLCLHLASDDERRLEEVEAAFVSGRPLVEGRRVSRPAGLRWRDTRTGFVGSGLPAARQLVGGIPPGRPVPGTAPLFMGFKSGFRKNQATEDDVTIPDGPLAGGTTMHVSYMRLRLDSWYDLLDDGQRVARMYAPEITPAQVRRFTDDAPSDPARYAAAAGRYGVVGHSQASARARRRGRPRIIRRDFNTTDGGVAGLHFVSLQRTIADFVATRKAMNAARATYLNPAITDTVNNGINEFIFVLRRANYVVPARAERAYPLCPGRASALA